MFPRSSLSSRRSLRFPSAPSVRTISSAALLGTLSAGVLVCQSCTPCEPIAPLREERPLVTVPKEPPAPSGPSEKDAQAFMTETETQLRALWSYGQRVQFTQNTDITHDTESLNAQAQEQVMEYLAKRTKEAARFDAVTVSPELRRKFELLRQLEDEKLPAAFRAGLDRLHKATVPNSVAAMELGFGAWLTQALNAAVRLGIPDELANGPLTADEVARRVGADRTASAPATATLSFRRPPSPPSRRRRTPRR